MRGLEEGLEVTTEPSPIKQPLKTTALKSEPSIPEPQEGKEVGRSKGGNKGEKRRKGRKRGKEGGEVEYKEENEE